MRKILFLNFITMLSFNLVHPVTPAILLYKDSPSYLNGFLFAAMSLSLFLFSPYFGKLSDKKGTKLLLIIGPLGYGFFQLFFGLFTNPFSVKIFMK